MKTTTERERMRPLLGAQPQTSAVTDRAAGGG
jgi:hypothetical protein